MESQPACKDARLLVVMGSSGCGKSTVGRLLSQRLSAVFIEGDDHHTPENKAKMASGAPLTDDDRWPWLKQLAKVMRSNEGMTVASCSALKKTYRQCITDNAGEPVLFIYLHGSRDVLSERLSDRKNHFMNPELLDSQLASLEIPDAQEFSITVDIDQPVNDIVDSIAEKLG